MRGCLEIEHNPTIYKIICSFKKNSYAILWYKYLRHFYSQRLRQMINFIVKRLSNILVEDLNYLMYILKKQSQIKILKVKFFETIYIF